MPRDLTNKTIIITGASSGIGAATAIECARAGMHIVLNARREDRLADVAQKLEQMGAKTAIAAGDVIDPAVTQRMLDTARDTFGGFYAVFANAGYGQPMHGHDMTMDQMRRIFEVNYFASYDLIRAAAHRLIDANQPGHLLMCSSCVAKFTMPRYGAYSATKAAQWMMCAAMRGELRPHNIEVSSVHPITTTTEFFEVAMREAGKATEGKKSPDHAPGMFVQTADQVARAVVKCLRNPKPEVWTSFIVRATAAMMTLSPRFAHMVMNRAGKKDE
jgi:short-subunit dehydrogenase